MCRTPKRLVSQAQDIYSLRDEAQVAPQTQLIEGMLISFNCETII